MTSEKPRRRWLRPRYSLATLFVVVTVFGCWLGLQVKWIRDRREFLSQKGVGHFSGPQLTNPFADAPEDAIDEPAIAPGLLWLFGEEGSRVIYLERTDNAIDEKRRRDAERLFPEAAVIPVETGTFQDNF